jgi:hypothetical protein
VVGRETTAAGRFLVPLFREITGTAVDTSKVLVREKGIDVEIVQGYCGSPDVGYAWESAIPTYSPSDPLRKRM